MEKVLCYKLPIFNNEWERDTFIRSLLKSLKNDLLQYTRKSHTSNTIKTDVTGFSFVERDLVEHDDSYVQVNFQSAFYKMVDGEPYLFVMKKIGNSTETRLHGRYDAFVGGHANESDNTLEGGTILNVLVANQARELREEVVFKNFKGCEEKYISQIFVSSEDVSRYHGCLYTMYEVPAETQIIIREKDKLEGDFISLKELSTSALLNSWAQECVKELKTRLETKSK